MLNLLRSVAGAVGSFFKNQRELASRANEVIDAQGARAHMSNVLAKPRRLLRRAGVESAIVVGRLEIRRA